MDLQGIVHEHLIKSSVRPFILCDHKLILVLPEVQAADNPVQFILPLVCFPDSAADLENKVVLEMLHCRTCLLLCRLPEGLQFIALQIFQQFIIRPVIPDGRRKCPVRVTPHITAPLLHQFLVRRFLCLPHGVKVRKPLPFQILIVHRLSACQIFLELLLVSFYFPGGLVSSALLRLPWPSLFMDRCACRILPGFFQIRFHLPPKLTPLLHYPGLCLQKFLVKLLNLLLEIPDGFLHLHHL